MLIGIAFIFDLSSFQFKNRKHILICFTIAASLISAHFFLLGEYTAGSVVALSAIRFIVSIFTTDKRMLWLFLVLILIAGVVTFDGFEDVLSISAMLLSTFSAFSLADKKLRLFMMCGTVLMITHNILIFTPAAILLESFFLASNLFAYYRYYIRATKTKVELKDLTKALNMSWSAESSFLPEQWSTDNPTRGQCAVTALVVQDYLGGEIIKCDVVGDDDSHFFNKLTNGTIVDLTKSQFDRSAVFENEQVADREKILSYPGTRERYDLLKSVVVSSLSIRELF